MTRGWESKSAEQQQADKANEVTPPRPRLSPAEQKLAHHHDGLQLSRKRLLHQFETAAHPSHRQMLQEALAEIDKRLASL